MKTFKLVIAGGGSTYTPGIVKSLLVQKDRFKLNELVLYDNNAKRQEDVGVIVRHVVEMFDPDVKLTLTTDPDVAFRVKCKNFSHKLQKRAFKRYFIPS